VKTKSFIDRLWILITEKANGKATIFAKGAGIAPGTFDAYLNGRVPKAEQLLRIRDAYGTSIDWLLTGEGPMTVEPKTATTESSRIGQDAMCRSPSETGSEEDVKTRQLLEKAKIVLKSDNPVAREALAKNIEYFAYAIEKERELEELKRSQKNLGDRLSVLEEALKKRESFSSEADESSEEKAM